MSICQPDPPVGRIFGARVAQRRACTYWPNPSSLPVCLCWAECSKELSRTINSLQLAPPHDEGHIISAVVGHSHTFSRTLSPLQVYSGTRVLRPEPMIRDPPVRCFTHGVNICRQPCPRRHMGALLRESVLYTRRRYAGGELLELEDRLRKVNSTDEQFA